MGCFRSATSQNLHLCSTWHENKDLWIFVIRLLLFRSLLHTLSEQTGVLKACCSFSYRHPFRNFLENFSVTLRFSLFVCICVSVCVSGAPPVIVNTEVDVLSHGLPSTVTAPTAATEEPPATAVSNQQQGICRFLKYLKPKIWWNFSGAASTFYWPYILSLL